MGIGIGQQRKIDLPAVREIFQDLLTIVTDGGEREPLLLKSGLGILQLDQLPFAVGSPIGRTEKEKNGPVRAFQAVQSLLLPKLVGGGERGRPVAHGESDVGERLD